MFLAIVSPVVLAPAGWGAWLGDEELWCPLELPWPTVDDSRPPVDNPWPPIDNPWPLALDEPWLGADELGLVAELCPACVVSWSRLVEQLASTASWSAVLAAISGAAPSQFMSCRRLTSAQPTEYFWSGEEEPYTSVGEPGTVADESWIVDEELWTSEIGLTAGEDRTWFEDRWPDLDGPWVNIEKQWPDDLDEITVWFADDPWALATPSMLTSPWAFELLLELLGLDELRPWMFKFKQHELWFNVYISVVYLLDM